MGISGVGEGMVERFSQQELTGRLIGRGRMPWEKAVPHLEKLNALWTDLQGLHIENLGGNVKKRMPAPPFTSHMWCWSPTLDRMLRLRVEDGDVIVGELRLDDRKDTSEKDPSEYVSIGATKIPLAVAAGPHTEWVDYCIGLFVTDELLGVAFFGIPRRDEKLSSQFRMVSGGLF